MKTHTSADPRRAAVKQPLLARFGLQAMLLLIVGGSTIGTLTVQSADLRNEDDWKAPAEESAKKNPLAGNSAATEAGRAIYGDRCANRHGKTGDGDGKDGGDLTEKPAKLNSGDITQETDGALAWKISTGRKPMPGYSKRLKPDDIWGVVNYIRTLKK